MNEVSVNKVIDVPCDERGFYRMWMAFLTPIHHFTPQVNNIAAELLWQRNRLSKIILDEPTLMKVLMSPDVRKDVLKECKITLSTYNVALNKLRKGGFFKDGRINPRLIPPIKKDQTEFHLMLMFRINEAQ